MNTKNGINRSSIKNKKKEKKLKEFGMQVIIFLDNTRYTGCSNLFFI